MEWCSVSASVGYALAADLRIEFLRANARSVGLALTGNEFASTIVGDAGNGTERGGGGADGLTGGRRENLFVIATLADSTVAASGRNLITDFSETPGDRIALRLLDADTTVGLDQKLPLSTQRVSRGSQGSCITRTSAPPQRAQVM
jgi:hypothetical protein